VCLILSSSTTLVLSVRLGEVVNITISEQTKTEVLYNSCSTANITFILCLDLTNLQNWRKRRPAILGTSHLAMVRNWEVSWRYSGLYTHCP